jgi:hypothetical protein
VYENMETLEGKDAGKIKVIYNYQAVVDGKK